MPLDMLYGGGKLEEQTVPFGVGACKITNEKEEENMRKKEYETSQCSTCGVHDAVGSASGRVCGGAGAEEQENGASAQADAAVPEGYIAINEKNFPDENFRDYVAREWDKNQDKYFSPSEIANAKWISCDNKEISNLKGIEFFTNIWLLECYYNNLTTIDLSHNKKPVVY